MADPHVLYIVSAVVVLALVAWVIAVIAKAPPLPHGRQPPAEPSGERTSKLDAHLEIQDEKPGHDKPGDG